MCCFLLQRVAVATCCSVLHFSHLAVALKRKVARVLQCVAVCCSVLQYVAVCCSMLQCVAVCCSFAVCCRVLLCATVCVSVRCIVLHLSHPVAYLKRKFARTRNEDHVVLQCVLQCVGECAAVRCSVLHLSHRVAVLERKVAELCSVS